MFVRLFAFFGRSSIYVLSFLLGALLVGTVLYYFFVAALDPGTSDSKLFQVNKGDNIQSISKRLVQEGLIRHWWSIYYPARMLKGEEAEKLNKIPVGEYQLSASMQPIDILQQFVDAKVIEYDLTVPEGATLNDIVDLIVASGLVERENLEKTVYYNRGNGAPVSAEAKKLFAKLRHPHLSLEGYLFPETYRFTKPVTAEEIIERMYRERSKRVTKDMLDRARELNLTEHELLTLASIIEREAVLDNERGIISSVFHNRLRIGMPLQSDPTVIYGIEDFDGNLTKKHLRTPSPYNTYLNAGLPPTPIANPGLASFIAALHPDSTDYVYFVSKNDGSGEHYFSSTYKEHQKAVDVFQRGKPISILIEELDQQATGPKIVPPPPARSRIAAKRKATPPRTPRGLRQLDPVRTN